MTANQSTPIASDTPTVASREPEVTKAQSGAAGTGARLLRLVLTERAAALFILMIILVFAFMYLGNNGYLFAPFNLRYMGTSLEALVPIALLALAEMFVIISGRSGIDLSVGATVSLAGMLFGYLIQHREMGVGLALVITVIFGTILGSVNGILVGYLRFPPLIATLATSYAYASLAMVLSGQSPISGPHIARANETLASKVRIGDIPIPLQVLTVLIPMVVVSWFVLDRTAWGRSLLAIGTNDVAARYAAQRVKLVRCSAYSVSGMLCGLAAVVNVAQFASARPDAGTAGSGMALPAITVAALGGVLIQGGFGRVSGVITGALLVTWLNAGLLISFQGSTGPRMQLLALGVILIGSILLNSFAAKKYNLRM
ncbi:ABC transporter permease [Trueperella sp. LYQ143]|uniref:ABC transporter permease n=1 Tax=unclassified Trueperella TaxID=2630174 RepID=UPI0039838DEB